MRTGLLIGSLVGLLAGCSADLPGTASSGTELRHAGPDSSRQPPDLARSGPGIAKLPDRGNLIEYGSRQPVRKGPYTLHAVQLSEQHALRAIGQGAMVVHAPNGASIRLNYERHTEHADGNWTWVGRPEGAEIGVEAILTFGDKAVFGSIPNGNNLPLQLTTAAGRLWIVESDRVLLGKEPRPSASASDDFLVPALPQPALENTVSMPPMTTTTPTTPITPITTATMATMATAPVRASAKAEAATPLAAATAANTVDLLIGYTAAFATRLGGPSQALTRLTFLVDVANEAFANSQAEGRVRLVHAMQVNYPDATLNKSALFDLTGVSCVPAPGGEFSDGGVSCTTVGQPAALQPLMAARELYGADLVSLVRNFESPENQSCGIGWRLGGGQVPIDYNSANRGMAVVSDTNGGMFPDDGTTCRNENLAHQLGHNMGLQHDRASAGGTDDSNGDTNLLDPEEYGRYPYSFGYRVAGSYYTLMASGIMPGEQGYRVFSNPRITFCGGAPCGVADQADDVRSLAQTMPGIALFRTPGAPNVWFRGDFDGDGRSDLLWRTPVSGQNTIWRSANSSTTQAVTSVSGQAWKLMGAADFDGDGKSDLLWRNETSGGNVIWKSANSATPQAMTTVAGTAWTIAGAGDFDGDGKADVLWRNVVTGANGIWKSANSATQQAVNGIADQAWAVVGVGDFNGDGKSDILWRNSTTGANSIWRSGNASTAQAVTAVPNTAWRVAAVGDFDGDNRADIFWRNPFTGGNALWKSGNSATPQTLATVGSPQWQVVAAGDFDGDDKADVIWRNVVTGANGMWKSANPATFQAVTTVHLNWFVSG
jgi:hypothetical protein